jgi:hypothetical protein
VLWCESVSFSGCDSFAAALTIKVMKRRIVIGLAAVVAVLLLYGGYCAYRASKNLVTLDVRNADVRKVISSIEWQTWERIMVHKDMTGKVTLHVTDAPLEAVLDIIAEQTSSRWNKLYPLYSSGKSLMAFKQAARGEIDPAEHGWTNLVARGGFGRGGGGGGPFGGGGRGGGGPFGGGPGGGFGGGPGGPNPPAQDGKVSFNFTGQPLEIALVAFARFGQTRVVPEDGTGGQINLILKQVPVPKAVGRLASQVHRKWDQLYTVQPNFAFGRRGGGTNDFQPDESPVTPGFVSVIPPVADTNVVPATNLVIADTNLVADTNLTDNPFAAMFGGGRGGRGGRGRGGMGMDSNVLDQVLQTLPAAQRDQVLADRARMEEMRNLPPEERQQRMQDMASRPEVQQRMDARARAGLVNSTPEQRVDRARVRLQRMQYQKANPPRP